MTARILDQGYRRYDGERLGVAHAVRSVMATTLRRILGLRRPARSKVLPVLSIVFAYVPAIVFVGVIALFGRFGAREQAEAVVPAYSDYYGFIFSAIVLFVTFVAPEALCPDRRSRLLSLYLASPLTRMTYLLAKTAAVAIVIAFVTVGPPLLLLIGRALQGAGPDGPGDLLLVLGRIVVSGTMLALLFTAVSSAVASLTDRRAVAAAATLLLLIGTNIAAGTLRFALDAPPEVMMLSLTFAPFELVTRIYNERGDSPEITTAVIVVANLCWLAACAAVTIYRYDRLQVTR